MIMASKSRILVVDDEEGMLEVCMDTLSKLPGVQVMTEQSSPVAAQRIKDEQWDLMITDIRMPGMDGMELLRIAHAHDPDMIVLMLTAFPAIENAVTCMKLGAEDYLTKPFIPDDLLATVQRLFKKRRIEQEHALLARQVEQSFHFDEIIGNSSLLQKVFNSIQKVAETNVDVLITGESGVGKELVARGVHQHSERRKGRFVPVDCGAIPENLLENEFFGHERGAFTGADRKSLGLLEFANGGTLFLDEIAELSLQMQAKLLRVLQDHTFRRVGGKEETDVDIRVIAATNKDLNDLKNRGLFREDLYYRVNVARIDIPALRERAEDIPLLVDHFVDLYAKEMGKDEMKVDPEVLDVLLGYSWPGNVRELQNVIKHALAMSSKPLMTLDDLGDDLVTQAGNHTDEAKSGFFALREQRIASFEKTYLVNLLVSAKGDVTQAARTAKLPRGTLYRLLNKHDISADPYRP